jgi:hypothetical protein
LNAWERVQRSSFRVEGYDAADEHVTATVVEIDAA